MSRLKMIAFGLAAAVVGSAASATTTPFDYNLKSNSTLGNNSVVSAGIGGYLPFVDTTSGLTLNMRIYGGHILDTKTSSGSALNSVAGATVSDWKNYGIGVSYGSDSTSNETHQIDNVGGGVDFVALVFDQAVTLSSFGLTAYPMSTNKFIDYDVSYMAFNGVVEDLIKGVNLSKFTTTSFDQASWVNSRDAVGSVAATVTTKSTTLSNIWLIGAAVSTTDRDDGFKLTSVSVSAVPEPASWAMMLVGFGAIGGALRSNRNRGNRNVSFG